MQSTAVGAELNCWESAGCPFRIEYPRSMMAELCAAAVDGFHRVAHGGLEIGGVLFGVEGSDAVRIMAYRALPCEHAFGPSFTLSERDQRALDDLLTAPRSDAELAGMQPVGWYLSHTRSEIRLSEKDLEIFRRYFAEPGQVTLVLRPNRFDPVRAGFFFYEPDGTVHTESTRHEFIIPPSVRAPADSTPVAEGVPEPARPRQSVASLISDKPRRETEAPAAASRPTDFSRRWWVWCAPAIVLVLAEVLYGIGGLRLRTDVALRALDAGGQLKIDWNRNSRVIQQSASGALEIEDGGIRVHDELSAEHLRTGNVTYLRVTDAVVVRLTVRGTDKSTVTEMTRFLGPPTPARAPGQVIPASRPATKEEAGNEPVQQAGAPEAVSAVRDGHANRESDRQGFAVTRRRLEAPLSASPRPAEPLLPAPPVIEGSASVAPATFIAPLPSPTLSPSPSPVPPPRIIDPGPSSGKIIWTGKLSRSGTIQILGNRASQGQIAGALPGTPVRLHVLPAELTQAGLRLFTADPAAIAAPEAPGAQNGWNRTEYVLNPKKAGEITVVEAPGQQNGWNRLTLRADRGDHSIVVLQWEKLPAESAIQSGGGH